MSTGSILSTLGPAPPSVKRVQIPHELIPEVPTPPKKSENSELGLENKERLQQTSGFESSVGRSLNLAGGSAVSVQVAESEKPRPKADLSIPNSGASSTEKVVQQAREDSQNENASGLTEDEEAYVQELKAIDREVRQHEAAHASTGGAFAGRPTYEYVTGPDGVRYAVSGKVRIDTAPVSGDPDATIRKLETVKRAALAPAQPSGQDRAVAAQAEAGLSEARAEKIKESREDSLSEAQENSQQEGSVGESSFLPSTETESSGEFGVTGGLISEQPSLIQGAGSSQSQPILDLLA